MTINVDSGRIYGIGSQSATSQKEKVSAAKDEFSYYLNEDKAADSVDSFEKTGSTDKADAEKTDAEKTEAEKEAEEAKKKLEEEKELLKEIEDLQKEIEETEDKIEKMPDGEEKDALKDKLTELNTQLDALISKLLGNNDSNNGSVNNGGGQSAAPVSSAPSGSNGGGQSAAPVSSPVSNGGGGGQSAAPVSSAPSGSNGGGQSAAPVSSAPSGSASTNPFSNASPTQNAQTNNDNSSQVQMPVTEHISQDLAQGLDKKLGDGFSAKVEQVAANINCNPNDLLGMMYSESGLNPKAGNGIGATGLIQFLPQTAKELGTSTSALKNMSAIEQMDYVEKFFMNNKKTYLGSSDAKLDSGTMYALCFLPAYAKNETLCTSGSGYYKWNKGADVNKDGSITKTDLSKRIASKYQEMYKEFV